MTCAVKKRKNETTDPALPEEKEEERRGRYTPRSDDQNVYVQIIRVNMLLKES